MAGTGGKRQGAGRKSKAEELGLDSLMQAGWPDEQRVEFLRYLADVARGHRKAAAALRIKAGELLMAYAYGKPRQQVSVGSDEGGLKIIVEYARDTATDPEAAPGAEAGD